MEQRDPPRISLSEGPPRDSSPGDRDDSLPPPSRRFPRLLSPPPVRRGSPRQMMLAISGVILAIVFLIALGFWLLRSSQTFVQSQTDYRLSFRKITLDPPPPRWFRGGSDGFLDRVEFHSKHASEFSTLDLDLAKLRSAFELNPLVKKVSRVHREYPNRIVVKLEYHEPVAVAKFLDRSEYLLDRDGDILPRENINMEWARPLIELYDFSPPFNPQDGHRWYGRDPKSNVLTPDKAVTDATRLAGFLRDKILATGGSHSLLYVDIHRNTWSPSGLFVQVGSNLMFRWENTTPDDPDAVPSEEARWTMLLDWVKRHPPLAESPTYEDLIFTAKGVVLKATITKPAPAGQGSGANVKSDSVCVL